MRPGPLPLVRPGGHPAPNVGHLGQSLRPHGCVCGQHHLPDASVGVSVGHERVPRTAAPASTFAGWVYTYAHMYSVAPHGHMRGTRTQRAAQQSVARGDWGRRDRRRGAAQAGRNTGVGTRKKKPLKQEGGGGRLRDSKRQGTGSDGVAGAGRNAGPDTPPPRGNGRWVGRVGVTSMVPPRPPPQRRG